MPEPDKGQSKGRKRKWNPKRGKDERSKDSGRRERVEETKRRRIEDEQQPVWAIEFTKEEIENEPRRPKHKVALIFGYCGTGYHGSQIEVNQRTIEGDLFKACVQAGAVSKANSSDPKKVAWVRCSRTDRNVHAAANVISARLIVEDADIKERINQHLPEQVRLWGIERLSNSFSAYQMCDGREYQYWIPTYCFLPPHPRTFLGIQLPEIAREAGQAIEYGERQKEVADFWAKAEEEHVAPVLRSFSADEGADALKFIFEPRRTKAQSDIDKAHQTSTDDAEKTSDPNLREGSKGPPTDTNGDHSADAPLDKQDQAVHPAVKAIKEAYKAVRRAYRIDEVRLERVRQCLGLFEGTHSYWNYTPSKKPSEPSAKRFIRSCKVGGSPLVVDGTEWLPINIHGQSFMLNQIRKMICMCALVVRCGSDPTTTIASSFGPQKLTIPRAPPTGLLLEHPVFDAYNRSLDRMPKGSERGSIDFTKFEEPIAAFKKRFIIQPMHEIEDEELIYYNFFAALDSLRSSNLLSFSAMGAEALKRKIDGGEDIDNVLQEDEIGQVADE